jgi:hypothetical protein
MLIMPGGGNDTLDYNELQRRTGWAMTGGAVTQGRTLNYLGMGEMKGRIKAAPNGGEGLTKTVLSAG